MSSIEYRHQDGDDYITEVDYRYSADNPAEIYGHLPYRHARLSVSLSSDASTLTVTVEILNGLSVLRDDLTPNQLAVDGIASVDLVGHTTIEIQIADGSGQSQTDISSISRSSLSVVVSGLTDGPIETDTTTVDIPGGGTEA